MLSEVKSREFGKRSETPPLRGCKYDPYTHYTQTFTNSDTTLIVRLKIKYHLVFLVIFLLFL